MTDDIPAPDDDPKTRESGDIDITGPLTTPASDEPVTPDTSKPVEPDNAPGDDANKG